MKRLVVLLLVALCSACVQLPDEGPVRVGAERDADVLDEGFPYEPRPPQPGETPQEIVRHFLDAMTANPITTSVAREFLAEEERDAWNPEARMITYADTTSPSGTREVQLTLDDAHHLDANGRWQGPLPDGEATLSFRMTIEDGEWRIADAPDAMIVSDSWFDERYRQVSLYFFDPTAEILVPEPVFVPRGGQLSTALMRGLIRGPGRALRGISRSFFPGGLSLDLSVPVSDAGLAKVVLQGDLAGADPETLELMTIQIAWTLRQDPAVERIRVTVGDTPITQSGTGADFPVVIGQIYDPSGVYAREELFALRDGRLVVLPDGNEARVAGPFGRRRLGVRSVSVDLPAERVAAVSEDGSSLLVGPVEDGTVADVSVPVTDATDLLAPAWDHAGRTWLLDRTADGAEMSVLVDGERRRLRVPGISGKRVVDFLVSRDGTRIAAALDRPGSDVVVVSRVVRDGARLSATRARRILAGDGEQLQVRDMAWRSPTDLAVLTSTEELSEVRTFSVDGSRALGSGDAATGGLFRADLVRLVSAPELHLPVWLVPDEGTISRLLPDTSIPPPPEGLASLTYVG